MGGDWERVWIEVPMISHGVEISIAGGVAGTGDALTIVSFFFFSFFLFFFLFFKTYAFIKVQSQHAVYSYSQQKPFPPHPKKHPNHQVPLL